VTLPNKEIIKDFLMSVAELEESDVEKIEITDPQTRIEFGGGKLAILDIKCTRPVLKPI
jgi:hypothetical protein